MIEVPSQYASWTAEQKRAFLEPKVLTAYARWQSAVSLGLSCEAHFRAMYENLRAEYDAL